MWIGIGLVIVLLCLSYVLSRLKPRAAVPALPVIGQVADFTLTNQLGQAVTLADLQGRVWVADIIFTRCAGPCPRMTQQMAELQKALPASSNARLISLTTDPVYDSPEILQRYGERYGAKAERWWFLTGAARQIADLAIDSLKLTAMEKQPEERENPADLFIHSTIFVLVDKQARLRGVFETGGEVLDWNTVRPQLLAAIAALEREP